MAASHTPTKESEAKRPRRPKGEGSIYTTKDGRLRGALIVTDPRTGQEVRRFVSGRTKAEVSRKLARLRQDATSGALPTSTTVQTYLATWLDAERTRVRVSTWRSRELHVRRYIVPAIGSISLTRLTPAHVEHLTTEMVESGLAPRTAASCRVTLRRALGDALRDGYVARNVAALARPPRVPSRSMEAGRDYLTPAQLRVLVDAVEDHPLGPLVTLAATTGLRQGELLGLAWPDIDFDGGTLTVHRSLALSWVTLDGERVQGWSLQEPKTAASRRTVNLPALAVTALERRRTAQAAEREAAGTAWQDRHDLVFTDALGRPMRNYLIGHAFPKMLDAAGLPHIKFHGLRHSAATAMLAAGVPLRTVADVLGHSTITITADTYAAVVPDLRRDAADAMDRALG